MIEKKDLKKWVDDKLEGTEYFLVELSVTPSNEISVEIDSDQNIDLQFCCNLNRYLEELLPDREVEDYSLEVGSVGITSPFKVRRQYIKNIGNEVETLLEKGEKVDGVLKEVNDNGIILTIEKKIKPEGSKRKILVKEDLSFSYEEIKKINYKIRFK
ncbi:MAG: ribosome assembly cofactor RimP [Massilibacteroides sp.]|nr:ribosome assembly cofactor RimP [Massilibacteroides sp.]